MLKQYNEIHWKYEGRFYLECIDRWEIKQYF